jgi:hypothetical protein
MIEMNYRQQKLRQKFHPSHYWRIDKFYWAKRMDTDNDTVKDYHDCKPLDPRHQDLPSPSADTSAVQQQALQTMKLRTQPTQRQLSQSKQREQLLEQKSKQVQVQSRATQASLQRQQMIMQQLKSQAQRQQPRTASSTTITRTGAPMLTTLQRQPTPSNPTGTYQVQQTQRTGQPDWEAHRVYSEPVVSTSSYTYYTPAGQVASLFGGLLKRKGW